MPHTHEQASIWQHYKETYINPIIQNITHILASTLSKADLTCTSNSASSNEFSFMHFNKKSAFHIIQAIFTESWASTDLPWQSQYLNMVERKAKLNF